MDRKEEAQQHLESMSDEEVVPLRVVVVGLFYSMLHIY
jgi:hypothetical protein